MLQLCDDKIHTNCCFSCLATSQEVQRLTLEKEGFSPILSVLLNPRQDRAVAEGWGRCYARSLRCKLDIRIWEVLIYGERALLEISSSTIAQDTSVQFSSVAQSCLTLCYPMNCSMPGIPVQHQLPEYTQTHVRRVGDAIQPSHPLLSPSPPAPNPSHHQGLFQ